MERDRGTVFVLTDYGLSDELAGVLKAVILREAPGAPILDLTHSIPAFDVRAGALALSRAVPDLGPGVVVAVVDPGVAGKRRAVAIKVPEVDLPKVDLPEVEQPAIEQPAIEQPASPDSTRVPTTGHRGPRYFVGPDNGLLVWAAEVLGGVEEAVQLRRPRPTGPGAADRGSTFDGRDVFAPAAAALWRGVPLSDLGNTIDPTSLVRVKDPRLELGPGVIETEVTWVDGFGNVQLPARPADARHAGITAVDDPGVWIRVTAKRCDFVTCLVTAFEDIEPGGIGLIVDSNGHLALAGDRSSAALTLGLDTGDVVTLTQVTRPDDGGSA